MNKIFLILFSAIVIFFTSCTNSPNVAENITEHSNTYSEIIESHDTAFSVEIDYRKTYKQLILESKYYRINPYMEFASFTDQVKVDTSAVITQQATLLSFNKEINSTTILSQMDIRGLRPATAVELLSVIAKYPELQHKFCITALGSVNKGDCCIAAWENSAKQLRIEFTASELTYGTRNYSSNEYEFLAFQK